MGAGLLAKTAVHSISTPEERTDLLAVDHLLGHATINHELLPRDKPGVPRQQPGHHRGDVLDRPYPARRMLRMIGIGQRFGTTYRRVARVDPAWTDRIDANLRP